MISFSPVDGDYWDHCVELRRSKCYFCRKRIRPGFVPVYLQLTDVKWERSRYARATLILSHQECISSQGEKGKHTPPQ